MSTYGDNVRVTNETAEKVTISIDKHKSFGKSRSGKSEIIATTRGPVQLSDSLFLNLTVWRKK